ncbi:membrane-associated phospholipid phosphatase [Bradyrhizobium sp. LM2.7]
MHEVDAAETTGRQREHQRANVLVETRIGTAKSVCLNRSAWTIIALIAVIDALWAWWIGIGIEPDLKTPISLAMLVLINYFYVAVRPNPRIATLASSAAQLLAFTAVSCVLIYLTVASNFPLIDRYLSGADAAVGFDWLAFFNWVQDHPNIKGVLGLAYASGIAQIATLLIVLNVLGMLERTAEFVWLYILTLLIVIPIAWLYPAESAWVHYGVTDRVDAYHLADFSALRAGKMSEIALARANGLVTFPSFHTALGLILIYATRGIQFLFPLSLGLNALMIVSTLTAGGHYFVDVIGGTAVVPLAVIIFGWVKRKSAKHRPAVGRLLSVARD